MANHDLQERLARQVADYGYGALNSVAPTEFKDRVGHDTSFINAARKAVVKSLQPDALLSMGQIKAIVLYAWRQKAVLHGNEKKELVHVKARIPEIDIVPPPRALPIDNDRDDAKADWPAIDAHDTFIAQDISLELPQPGAIISVKYGNYRQRRDPVYEALIAQPQTPGEIASSPGKAFEKADCETGYSKHDLSDLHQKMEPKPAPVAKPSTDDSPYVGYMVDHHNYGGYYKEGETVNNEIEKRFVFQKPNNYDWVKRLVDKGVNYLNYQIHGSSATVGSLSKTLNYNGLAPAQQLDSYYMKYTEALTGLKTPQEMLKVQEVGQGINPEFQVHAWGHSGIGSFGANPKSLVTMPDSSFQEPLTLKQVEHNATTEAHTVAGVFEVFDGKIENYHWHYGMRAWISLNTEFNEVAVKNFVREFKLKLPGVKLWFSGLHDLFPATENSVLDLFDFLEPRGYEVDLEEAYRKDAKFYYRRLQGGKLVSWQVPDDSEEKEKEIINWSANIGGVSFYPLTGVMWDQEKFIRIKNLRQNFNKTQ